MTEIVKALRTYEDEVIVPMVQWAGLEPLRTQDDRILGPGTIAAFVNGSSRSVQQDGLVRWSPLSVQYTDGFGSIGTVYSLEGLMKPETQEVVLEQAEISGILALVRHPQGVQWLNPLTGSQYRQFMIRGNATDGANHILLNSWRLFCGGILPLLKNESYRFVHETEKMAFQVTMLHHLRTLYDGIVA